MAKVFSPFSSRVGRPRYATTMTFMGRGREWERRMVRGAHTTWKRFVKRAIDKSFGGKRRSAALPTVSILRSLPTLRTI